MRGVHVLSFLASVHAAHPLPESLRLTLIAPESVAAGASVPITLRLMNTSDRPVDVYLVGRSVTFDIVARNLSGIVVWHRLEHAVVQNILQVRTLQPHATLEWSDVWRPECPPGPYTLEGVLPTDGEPLRSAAKPVRIAGLTPP